MNTSLEEIIQFYTVGSLNDSQTTIIFHPDKNIPPLATDSNGLRQIITNLLNNAIDALDGTGTITVTTALEKNTAQQEEVIITIRDDGPGIDQNLRDTLFQAGATSKEGGHGGLGLAIVKRIARQLGGSVTLISSDEGAAFSVNLPTGGA